MPTSSASTKRCWPRPARTTTSPISTKTPAPPRSTPPAPPACPRACISPIGSWCCTPWRIAGWLGTAPAQGRLHREDVYMPITPMFHVHAWGMPYVATMLGLKQVYPGRYDAGRAAGVDRATRTSPSRTACRPCCRCSSTRGGQHRLSGLEDGHRRLGAVAGSVPDGAGTRHRRVRRLRHVETAPLLTVTHLNARKSRATSTARPHCACAPAGPCRWCDAAHRRRRHATPGPRRRIPGGSRLARSMADPGLFE